MENNEKETATATTTTTATTTATKKDNSNFAATDRYFDRITGRQTNNKAVPPNVAALRQFFTLMPKGGDIHHHFSGAIYAETYLDWVGKDGYYINKKSLKIQINRDDSDDNDNDCCTMTVAELLQDEALYHKLLSTWSVRDYKDYYHNNKKPPDSAFFDTFGYFDNYSTCHHVDGLRNLQSRAKQQNVQYIETQLTMVRYSKQNDALDAKLWQFQVDKDDVAVHAALEDFCSTIIDVDPDFETAVNGFNQQLYHDHISVFGKEDAAVDNNDDDDDEDCFMLRYQVYAVRTLAPSMVFCALYAGFVVASRCNNNDNDNNDDALVRGVNIVGPENHPVALRDYWLHMQMFRFLRIKFSKEAQTEAALVHVAMHAGELTMGMVVPEHLTHHVTDAINVAGAERIGHGVDICWEKDSPLLLEKMKREEIAVEVSLSSNDDILGISPGPQHPVSVYLQHGVPIVLCTDDAGVARTSLESQYTMLASSSLSLSHNISYAEIKAIVMNSIRYSFLSSDDKNKVLDWVERRFEIFESKIAEMTRSLE